MGFFFAFLLFYGHVMAAVIEPIVIPEQPVEGIEFRATSNGYARFYRDGAIFYSKGGGAGGGRGFNVAAIDPSTGNLIGEVRNFDTWASRTSGTAHNNMMSYINGLPEGTLLMVATADEGGLNAWSGDTCQFLGGAHIGQTLQFLEGLGSTKIRDYCYGSDWNFIAIKGSGAALDEDIENGTAQVSVKVIPGVPVVPPEPEFEPIDPFIPTDISLTAYSSHYVRFSKNDEVFYYKTGGAGGGRGFNVAAIDPSTGNLIGEVRNFDTWASRTSGTAHNNMMSYINGLPEGTLLMVATADEGGLNAWSGDTCQFLGGAHIGQTLQFLEGLGSTKIRDYCYRSDWSMITVKGSAVVPIDEEISTSYAEVTTNLGPAEGTYSEYDLIDHLSVHHYYDGNQVYNNAANGSLNCGPFTGQVCGWINDQHAHTIQFNSPESFVASGIVFHARLDEDQAEHVNITLNGSPAIRWQEPKPLPGDDTWYTWAVYGSFPVQAGGNVMVLETDNFPADDSSDGSIHFEPKDGERSYFAFFTGSEDSDGDGLTDDLEDKNGDGIHDVESGETNPFKADTDGDDANDLEEINQGYDPNDDKSVPGHGPIVESVDPHDGETEIDSFRNIVMNFDRPVQLDEELLESTMLLQHGSIPRSGAIDLSSDRKTITFVPELFLFPNSAYKIILEKGITDDDGYLLRRFTSTFHTRSDGNLADPNEDSDGDGLPDYQENFWYNTDPSDSDTDDDGAGDATEVDQGSDPKDNSDGGQAPPEEELVEIEFTVGDPSGSDSEVYWMSISGKLSFGPLNPGEVETRTVKFRRGEKANITVNWRSTKLDEPDYDYVARVGGFGNGQADSLFTGAGFLIQDSQGLLGSHNESTENFASGKSATLYVPKLVLSTDSVEVMRSEELNLYYSVQPDEQIVYDNMPTVSISKPASIDSQLNIELAEADKKLVLGNLIMENAITNGVKSGIISAAAWVDQMVPLEVRFKKSLEVEAEKGWGELKQDVDSIFYDKVFDFVSDSLGEIVYAGEGPPSEVDQFLYGSTIQSCASGVATELDNELKNWLSGHETSTVNAAKNEKVDEDFSINFNPIANLNLQGGTVDLFDPFDTSALGKFLKAANDMGLSNASELVSTTVGIDVSSDGSVGKVDFEGNFLAKATCSNPDGKIDYFVGLQITFKEAE